VPDLFVRISNVNHAFLLAEKERTGRSLAQCTDILLNGARKRGLRVPEQIDAEEEVPAGG
jgi:hypothetical protein